MFEAKVPDSDQDMRSVDMEFQYRDSFTGVLPDAYERLTPGGLAWRCVPLHPFGWDRSCLEADRFDRQRLGDEQYPRPIPLPAWRAGDRQRQTTLSGSRWKDMAFGLCR